MQKEIWRPIEGYEGLYEISNLGKIKSNFRQGSTTDFLKISNNGNGYMMVRLCKNGKAKKYYLHRLLAQTFIDNPEDKPQVNHINENRSDNRLENLEWVTQKENNNHGNHNLNSAISKRSGKAKKNVQLDLDGNELGRFDFLIEAAKTVNGNSINISRAARNIRNRETAYGYKWRYE
ncbi:NUMOD4 motif-containing HNH endonuclease [Enterococcus faecium]|uniref:NUMOD4 motif-containing HNH endonuclease n=1 Tax=Enterococcus faecium TaxID=1352 RepID=UPI001CC0555D|nr:NUMOD4 motif-containing HNH endonuclease [Enterococcus faecium]